jgi:hypothetical protein
MLFVLFLKVAVVLLRTPAGTKDDEEDAKCSNAIAVNRSFSNLESFSNRLHTRE